MCWLLSPFIVEAEKNLLNVNENMNISKFFKLLLIAFGPISIYPPFCFSVTLHDIVHMERSLTLVFEYL